MSALPSDYFYGWDLLFKTIAGQVNKKDDLLIALVHFVLTKHSQFRCIGLGDDVSGGIDKFRRTILFKLCAFCRKP